LGVKQTKEFAWRGTSDFLNKEKEPMNLRLNPFSRLILVLVITASLAGLPALSAIPTASAQVDGPEVVSLPGTHQSELGCSGDWQVDCAATFMVYDAEDDVWQATFNIQPGNDQDKKGPRYKAALNKSWDVNYGLNATQGGADIPLVVPAAQDVKFYYDHKTHWITDNFNTTIAVATGDFQSELGCQVDNDPGCLRSWLQDPDGDGTFSLSTRDLPAGTYSLVIAINESTDETYGMDGAAGGAPVSFTVAKDGAEVYIAFNPESKKITASAEGAPKGNVTKAAAYWVSQDTILWKVTGSSRNTYELSYSQDAALELTGSGITGGETIRLRYDLAGASPALREKYPYLTGYIALKIDPADAPKVQDILRSQMAVQAFDDKGKMMDATGLQIPGVLDDLFTYTGALGLSYENGVPTLRVWAPTAQSVRLHLFKDAAGGEATIVDMQYDSATGVWSASDKSWDSLYYLYEVKVFAPSTGKVETNLVTDPYSISLSMNSLRSQIVDLASAALKPKDWDKFKKPALQAPEDAVIYELHIRDFSAFDESIPEALRGTYLAFTEKESNGMQHLKALADAGLTHIHLLPTFDIASINEDKSTWVTPDYATLAAAAPDAETQRLAIADIKDQDGFNWGYDPFHYTTPEGSYATQPDGTARLVEFRRMVQSLNEIGLRVVMDVVYNHTNASGESAKSVLDKVVPGYYHRLNKEGGIERSTCCENTATEHAMMEKLMIDSLITWAKYYKVDGFRFDLMGHHMLSNMVAVRQALDSLTLEKDGVDGKSIIIYGEGWDFGEVAKNALGVNATQLNLAGTGIGTFNDRLRDAARGGGPFNPVRDQGFITGLATDPNTESANTASLTAQLLQETNWIQLGLAGNLKTYELVTADGKTLPGAEINYKGAPAGYTLDPQEQVVYVSAHDNETLFDAIQWKAPASASIEERVRMNNLGLSLVALSQGMPFFHAGDDLLRSKSLDGNSYNSGDWFNRLDFTYQSNNWGVGLPSFDRPVDDMKALLSNPALKASPADIAFSRDYFRELLQIRKSSALFRLQTAEEIQQRLHFLNTGTNQIPGLIVMVLDDTNGADLDPNVSRIVVAFNASKDSVTFNDASLKDWKLELHPVQQKSVDTRLASAVFDAATGSLTIPGRSTVVWVESTRSAAGSWWMYALGGGLVAAVAAGLYLVLRKRKPTQA
jgi:pullulanase